MSPGWHVHVCLQGYYINCIVSFQAIDSCITINIACIWQTGQLTCVDLSRSRLRRLQDILDGYMPKSYVDDGKVRLIRGNGAAFVAEEEALGNRFDRVNSGFDLYYKNWCVTI